MFRPFLDSLRRHGVPASLREYLDLMAGMQAGLSDWTPEGFYHLARVTLVKNESHIDRFDRAFAETFAGLDEIPVEGWLQLSQTNITGMFLCARAAFGLMRHQSPQGGRIINNGSISADVPRPGSVPYTVSKHAVTGLTRTVSLDGRPFNIACGQVDIGNALTNMAEAMTKGVPQADGSVTVIDHEPGLGFGNRIAVYVLNLLPIEWLL